MDNGDLETYTLASKETKSPKVVELQKRITEANGKPFKLGKTVHDKPIYMSVTNKRFSPHPEEVKSLAEPKYDPSLEPQGPVDGIAFVNVYVGEDEEVLTPAGRYYWFLRGDTAYGGPSAFQQKYLSEVDIDQSKELQKSLEWWNNSFTTTKVEESYREQGIGGFMLAASFANLDLLGFRKFDPWNLTPDARKLWSRFWECDKVKTESTFSVRPDSSGIEVQDFLTKPIVEKSIAEFI